MTPALTVMTTLKTIIGNELRRMRRAGIIDATPEEALGYLVWRHLRKRPWKLSQVIRWILRYADYHREAVEVEHVLNQREAAECAALRFGERHKRLRRRKQQTVKPTRNRRLLPSPRNDDKA